MEKTVTLIVDEIASVLIWMIHFGWDIHISRFATTSSTTTITAFSSIPSLQCGTLESTHRDTSVSQAEKQFYHPVSTVDL